MVTVLANEWAVEAVICHVRLEQRLLNIVTTGVRTGHFHKLAFCKNRVLAQMLIKITQLSHPLALQALVWAVNFELPDFALKMVVANRVLQAGLPAKRTGAPLQSSDSSR